MERIRNHILEQARREADTLVETARAESDARVKAARAAIARDLESRVNHATAEIERRERQARERLLFEQRLEALARKTQIIDAVFKRAAERFVESPRYRDWLERRLGAVAHLVGQVVCHPRDRAVFRTILERLAARGDTGLKMAGNGDQTAPRDIAGGAVVRTEKFDLDLTLGSALNDLRGRILPDLTALAFGALEKGNQGDA